MVGGQPASSGQRRGLLMQTEAKRRCYACAEPTQVFVLKKRLRMHAPEVVARMPLLRGTGKVFEWQLPLCLTCMARHDILQEFDKTVEENNRNARDGETTARTPTTHPGDVLELGDWDS